MITDIEFWNRKFMLMLIYFGNKSKTKIVKTNKKVVYLTQWAAKDPNKECPHSLGFEAPIVDFPQDMDATEVAKHCRELSNDEFECIGATPREIIDGSF